MKKYVFIMKINVIDWKLIGTCNLRCAHCYGPPKSERALKTDKLASIIDKFSNLNPEWVVLTGGEPLLVPNLETILSRLKNNGIKIALSTNGYDFENNESLIRNYVDSLNIPLDGSTPEIHAISRNDVQSYFDFFNILDFYLQHPEFKPGLLRAGTVYSKATKGDLQNIERKLNPYFKIIDSWKIYELIEYSIQREQRANLLQNQSTFNDETKNLLKVSKNGEKILLASVSRRNKAYFMINPRGDLVVPTEIEGVTKEIVLGNILDDNLDDLVGKWGTAVSDDNYRDNHKHYLREDVLK